MQKSAFLIIAHNEFEILQMLISSLDSNSCDIYVHFDAKVEDLPNITTKNSRLYFTRKRIDVRWGHISQMDCEYVLWEEAHRNGPYDFYHLLSGVHLPLKPIYEIMNFYSGYCGKSIVMPFCTKGFESSFKVNNYNFCVRNMNCGSHFSRQLSQIIWKTALRVQRILGIKVNRDIKFKKSSQWVSLSEDAVSFLLQKKKNIRKRYRFSFCCDEYFVWTELASSKLSDQVIEITNILKCEFVGAHPIVYALSEIPELSQSEYLFARKFSIRKV